MTRKASASRPFKRRDGKSGPDPRRNRAALVPDDAHLIDGRYQSMSDQDSADDGGDTPSLSEGEDDPSRDGNDEDNYAVAMAPPAKRTKTRGNNRAPRRARKVIAKSDDDGESDGDNAFMASMDELLKGVGVDPLDVD